MTAPRQPGCRPSRLWLVLPLIAGFAAGPVRAEPPRLLISDLSDWRIEVGSNFAGTDVLVFGAIAPGARPGGADKPANQVVVVLRGEPRREVVRRKERILGIWVNGPSLHFTGVPAIYQVATTDRLERIAPQAALRANEIGIDNLALAVVLPRDGPPPPAEEVQVFRAALVRQHREAGVFREQEESVTLIQGALFRGSLHLPADVPLGRYTVTVYLMREGKAIARNILPLRIERAGVEKRISRMSERRPLLYGLIAVALALGSGWLGTILFRDR